MNSTITRTRSFPPMHWYGRTMVVLIAFFCGISNPLSAQTAASYGFSAFSGTYTSITGTAVNILSDDITQTGIPIGFTFNFCGTNYTQGSVTSNGWFSFTNTSSTIYTNDASSLTGIAPCVLVLWDDLSGATGSAAYTTTGTAPNRVFTMQWSAWMWNYSGSTNVISMQLKLYETTNYIQCIYSQGPNAPNIPSATIGIANSNTDYQTLNNSSTTPVSSTTFTNSIASKPATGQVYQWVPPSPCTSAPTVTVSGPATYCPGVPFTLVGTTVPLSGLSYQWESTPAGTTTWAPIAGATSSSYNSPGIVAPTSYRLVVICAAAPSVNSISNVLTLTQGTFYFCYCASAPNTPYSAYSDIGNVTIKKQPNNVVILNNGVATPLINNPAATGFYTNYALTVPPVSIFRDSLYWMSVTQISQNSFLVSTVASYIDYNRDGTFQPTERMFYKVTASATQEVNDTFRVPSITGLGLTGMRVIIEYGTNVAINPCGLYNTYGETEDYLVNVNFPPCTGPANPGTAYISDTTLCPGYTVNVGDTTHEKLKSFITWNWQSSINNGASWNDVAGSTGKDTLNNQVILMPTRYRMRMVCGVTADTTYSNSVSVRMNFPYQCYPYSQSNGGIDDSSDIGAFQIGSFVMSTGGPHLLNPQAIYKRTDNTMIPGIVLYTDSTYRLSFFHTMRGNIHADARVSLFMDFNNDLQYNAGQLPNSELVFSGVTTAGNWYIDTVIKIPTVLIPNVPTGMRVVLNNDVNPAAPANLGAGPYVSGETEDYVIMFRRTSPAGMGGVINIQDLALYPNPTSGRFTVAFNAMKAVNEVQIEVTTITGQKIMSQHFGAAGTQFVTDLDLSNQAKGIYFVQIKADGEKITRKLIVR